MLKCKSCETVHTIHFQYCPTCGAKVVRERLTLRALFKAFLTALTNLEGPIWRTLRDLTIRPRLVTQGFIEGVRMRYLSPVRYLLIAFTISGLAFIFFQSYFEEAYDGSFASGFREGYMAYDDGEEDKAKDLAEAEMFLTKLQYIFQKYTNLLGFLYIPVFALMAHWWLNRPNRFNLAESLVASTYLYTHSAMLLIPFYFLLLIPGVNFTALTLATNFVILYFVWMVQQSYQTSIWKSLLVVVVTYLIYFFVTGAGIALYLMISMLLERG